MSTGGNRRHLKQALLGAIAAIVLVWFAHLSGGAVGLAYLGPAVLMFLLVWLGRYPGERLLIALARSPRKRHKSTLATPAPRALAHMPRGGNLLGRALGGRAPPLSPG